MKWIPERRMHLCSKEATRHHITCVRNVPYTISFPKANRPSLYFLDASSLYSDSLTHIALLIKSFHQTGIRLQLLQFIHAYLSLLSLCDKSCQWIDITMSERGQFGQGGGTACGHKMVHRKWKESKQQPSMLPGPAVPGCSLVSFHILWAILSTSTVLRYAAKLSK